MSATTLDDSLGSIPESAKHPPLSGDRLQQILVEWNQTICEYPRDRCIHELFEEQVALNPSAPAVLFGEQTVSYAELNAAADEVARYLRLNGVGPGVLAGISIDRSIEMIASLLGILKAGAAYVPLDPKLPESRLRFLVRDTQLTVLLTSDSWRSLWKPLLSDDPDSENGTSDTPQTRECHLAVLGDFLNPGAALIRPADADKPGISPHAVDAGQSSLAASPLASAPLAASQRSQLAESQTLNPEFPAYVNYTSGSTGDPKGVLVPHRGVVRLVKSPGYASLTSAETILHLSTLSFDASTFEIWGALLNGGQLVLMPTGPFSPVDIGNAIRQYNVTTILLATGMFNLMVDERPEDLRPLRQLITGGDALSRDHAIRAKRALPDCRIINAYGPTENSVITCFFEVQSEVDLFPVPPIGRPISNTQVYLLNESLQPVDIGVEGELYTGGDGLACEYLNAPKLTAERFIPNPFSSEPGARLYRTGDMARYRADGNIEFLGRRDHQVKIRGFRVELGEIESNLRMLPQIRDAAVVIFTDASKQKTLFAYLVLSSPYQQSDDAAEMSVTATEIRAALLKTLPDYMIPSRFIAVESLPLASTGKVDRARLKQLPGTELLSSNSAQEPQSELELQLADIWQSILRRDAIGIHDNFFELGGHSLLAVMITSRLAQQTGMQVPLRMLFEHPTIAELAQQLEDAGDDLAALAITPADRSQPLPATHGQQRMWLLHQMLPDAATYNVPVAWSISGNLDVPRLKDCLMLLTRRHEALRTAFQQNSDGQITQVIAPPEQVQLPWMLLTNEELQRLELASLDDAADSPDVDAENGSKNGPNADDLQLLLSTLSRQPFDLEIPPLWRVHVIELNSGEPASQQHILLLTFHHSLADEWSLRLLALELQQLYSAHGTPDGSQLTPVDIQYADFAAWEARQNATPRMQVHRDYWKNQLSNLPEPLELPTDRIRSQQPDGRGAIHEFPLAQNLIDAFRELARQEDTTLFTVLLAAWHVWLARYTGQADVIVGTPMTLRNRPELQNVFGFLLNTLPVRARIEPKTSFRQIVRQVRNTLIDAYSHADLPFEQMVEMAVHERMAGQQPLHQVMFVLLEQGQPLMTLGQATARPVSIDTATSKCDLTLSMTCVDEHWSGLWEYDTDLFLPETAARMAEHWTQLLQSITHNPDQNVELLELITPAERHRLLVEWNQTEQPYPRDLCIHELFEEQANLHPGATAVLFDEQRMSYAELNAAASTVADYLQRNGVGPGVLVGLSIDRSIELIVSLVGILKAGGAYVPLDPGLPESRLQFIVRDTGLAILLTSDKWLSHWQHLLSRKSVADETVGTSDCHVVVIAHGSIPQDPMIRAANSGNSRIPCSEISATHCTLTESEESRTTPRRLPRPDCPAYVNYTSGSTGDPKGVLIPHRGVVRLLKSVSYVSLTSAETVLHLSTMSFDAATFEIWGALLNGGQLALMPVGPFSPVDIGNAIRKYNVTTVLLTTGMFNLMVDERPQDLRPLRQLLTGGDVMCRDHAIRALRALPDCRIINAYGPTENTVITCSFPVQNEADLFPSVPVGRPISNTQVYLLDSSLHPVPVGVVGELFAGGDGLASEYLNAPETTAKRFIFNRFSSVHGSRLYRTGDMARFRPDGNIEFVGRRDHQVKIRGFRIELGEIEAALRAIPGIHNAVVLVQEFSASDKRLIAFLIPQEIADGSSSVPETDARTAELRSQLKQSLPDYMIPAAFLKIDELPLTPNGKLDRKALLALATARTENIDVTPHKEPTSELEKQLAELWKQALQKGSIGIHDNFFELGGHSLLAVMITSRLAQQTGMQVPLRMLFEYPTIAELALQLEGAGDDHATLAITPADRSQPLPATHGQQRMWLLHQMLPDPATYNMPVAWSISGHIDIPRLKDCLMLLARRHEALRTAFRQNSDGQITQVITPPEQVQLPWMLLTREELEGLEVSSQDDAADSPDDDVNNESENGSSADELQLLLSNLSRQPFDLEKPPLWRAHLIEQSNSQAGNGHSGGRQSGTVQYVLLLTFHHSLADEWSLRVLALELQQLYSAHGTPDVSRLTPVDIQYADFAAWEARQNDTPRMQVHRDYWKNQLSNLPEPLELPTDRIRSQQPDGRGAIHEFPLADSLVNAFKELARQEDTTLFTVLLAAWHVWLARYTGQPDVIVGTPMTLRNRPELQNVFGFLLNTLPIRARIEPKTTFREIVRQVRNTLIDAYSHADLPFEQMVEMAVHERMAGQQPLHQVMFVLLEQGQPLMTLGQATARPVSIDTATSKCDLTLSMTCVDEHWSGLWEYDTDLFLPETAARMAEHWTQLLQSITHNPDQNVELLELITPAERHRLLVEWNQTEQPYPRDLCVHHLFEQQVLQTPHATAVVFEDQTLTYQQLSQRANLLACHLIDQGVKPEALVGLCLERSPEMIVALLAILKAGAAYVPLDPNYPVDRIRFIIQDSGLQVLVSQRITLSEILEDAIPVVWLEDFNWQPGSDIQNTADNRILAVNSGQSSRTLAYTIYTSGSTGQPKGVEIEHQALVNCVIHFRNQLNIRQSDVWLAITTLCFDISALEVWLPLLTGARCVIASAETAMDGRLLAEAVEHYGVTVLQATPATWKLLLFSEWKGNQKLQLLCGGEGLPQDLADQLATLGSIAWNVYGPTEATIWASATRIEAHQPVTIGTPIANTRMYILDEYNRPVPAGLRGELLIGGDCLARGYHNRPELTESRFIPNPFFVPDLVLRQDKEFGLEVMDPAEEPLAAGPLAKSTTQNSVPDKAQVVDLAKDPLAAGPLARSTTQNSVPDKAQVDIQQADNSQMRGPQTACPQDARLYRTGDVARYRHDGTIECLGRVDFQVKIRGFRIELGEIEAALRAIPGIHNAVVLVQEFSASDRRLIAFLIPQETAIPQVTADRSSPSLDTDARAAELRNQLKQSLPDYMIPARFLTIDELPLTPNGKLDRKALLTLATARTESIDVTPHEEPTSELEKQLAELWKQALQKCSIGIHDNFFELGGHSLLAVMITSRLAQQTGMQVPLRMLFEYPTIAELALQLEGAGDDLAALAITPADRSQPLPATHGQQRMWLLHQMLPDPATYNVPVAWSISGNLDVPRLKDCLMLLARRHEALRTAFRQNSDGQITQVITPPEQVQLPWMLLTREELERLEVSSQDDAADSPDDDMNNESENGSSADDLQRLLSTLSRQPFDLEKPPLWRAHVIELNSADPASHQHVLLLTFHHSLADEWSLRVLALELQQLYSAQGTPDVSRLIPVDIQYADFAAWEARQDDTPRMQVHRDYWKNQLSNLPEPLELPTDRIRSQQPDGRGAIHEFPLADSIVSDFKELARQEDTTLFTVLLAAWHVWLARYTGQPDVIVGTPMTLRNRPELQNVFGFLLNTLPVRARIEPKTSFRQIVRQVRNTLIDAYSHADLPFEQMVEMAVHERMAGQQPLHQVMFVLLEQGQPLMTLGQATARPVSIDTATRKCDLTLSMTCVDDHWSGLWEYDTDLFLPETAARMAEHWTQLLQSITHNPDQNVELLELITPAERHRLLVEWNQTEQPYPRDLCVHHLFELQAQQTPNATAVIFEDQTLTYQQLSQRANLLACHLIDQGVKPEALVGLCLERSPEMIVALLAILKAGAAYVPLDPQLPDSRLVFHIDDAVLPTVLTSAQHAERLQNLLNQENSPTAKSCQIVCLEDASEQRSAEQSTDRQQTVELAPTIHAMSPVYVNYTSGSTGQPKGVLIPHRAVVRLVKSPNVMTITPSDTLLHLSTLSFDASTFEIWGALLNGARLVLMPPGPPSLAEIGLAIRSHQVTTLWLTAGLFHLMIDERPEELRPLRQLLAGGDVLSVDHVSRAKRLLPDCQLINGYGPTENTTFTCCYAIDEHSVLLPSVPIGRPVSNTQVYLLDDSRRPVPPGVTGELYTGGDGLASGYLNDQNLTEERFIASPFSADSRSHLYRTGDLARYRPDGNIEFIGRRDQQVKIRGFRVELGEIEAALRTISGVQNAAVLVQQYSANEKRLVAFLILQEPTEVFSPVHDTNARAAHFRNLLKKSLPDYMIPAKFLTIAELPLTGSGKVDRKALLALATGRADTIDVSAIEEPETELEKQLSEIWKHLFQRESIGRHEDFFSIGGHSLLAARLVSEIDKRLGIRISISKVLQAPTIASLAQQIELQNATAPWTSLVCLQPSGDKYPLFCTHGWGGGVYGFLELARRLAPDRPVYGLQAVGLDGKSARHKSLEEMARHYVSEIRTVQPHGPYHLTGHSLGGWVAFAVAQELLSQGEKVAFLAMLDTQSTVNVGWKVYLSCVLPSFMAPAIRHLKKLIKLPAGKRRQHVMNRLKWLKMHLPGVRRELPETPTETLSVSSVSEGRLIDYYDAVAVHYKPQPFKGDAILFAGADAMDFPHVKFWKNFISGEIKFHQVPGVHHSLIGRRYAADFAVLFRQLLDEASPHSSES